MSEFDRDVVNKKWFCPLPFVHFSISPNGQYQACCEAKNWKDTIHNTSPLEFFNGEFEQKLRQGFLSDDPTSNATVKETCYRCLQREQDFGESKRMREIRLMKEMGSQVEENYYQAQKDITAELDPYLDFFKIQAVGNKCNMRCIMCGPMNSSLIARDLQVYQDKHPMYAGSLWPLENPVIAPFQDISDEMRTKFFNDLDKILKNCHTLQFTGGEPTIIEQGCWDIIDWCADNGHTHLEIHFNTNGTCPAEKFESIINKFRRVTINVSIDAIAQRDEYIRWNTVWDVVERNMYDYAALTVKYGADKFNTYVNPSPQALNVGYMDEVLEFVWENTHHKKCIPDNIVITPEYLNAKHLPQSIKKMYINKLQQAKPHLQDGLKPIYGVLNSPEGNPLIFYTMLAKLQRYDEIRGTDWRTLWPEFIEFLPK